MRNWEPVGGLGWRKEELPSGKAAFLQPGDRSSSQRVFGRSPKFHCFALNYGTQNTERATRSSPLHGSVAPLPRCSTSVGARCSAQNAMAGRSRAAVALLEQVAACLASLPDGLLLLAAGVGSRGAEEQH